jgi:hypothetical protein
VSKTAKQNITAMCNGIEEVLADNGRSIPMAAAIANAKILAKAIRFTVGNVEPRKAAA